MSSVQIDILIDNDEMYGSRNWEHVPSKGDYIKLEGTKAGWYFIKEVNWQGNDYPIVMLNVAKESK